MDFEWDPSKNAANRLKHGIDFEDAARLFQGAYLELVDDRSHYEEERWIAVGEAGARVLVVIYTWRGKKCRVISARKATSHERKAYHEAIDRAATGSSNEPEANG